MIEMEMIAMGTSIGYAIIAAVCFAAPVFVFFRAKKYDSAMIYPVIVGAVTYFIATRMSDLAVWMLFSEAPMSYKAVIATELAAFSEEIGRWLAMKYPVTNIKTSRAAFCCGIGHGGLECYMRGAAALKLMTAGNSRNMGLLLGATDSLNMIVNIGVHIALSLLIFKKIQEQKSLRWLALAILLHYLLNALVGVVSIGKMPILTGFTGIFFGLGVILTVYKIIDGENVLTEIKYHTDDI